MAGRRFWVFGACEIEDLGVFLLEELDDLAHHGHQTFLVRHCGAYTAAWPVSSLSLCSSFQVTGTICVPSPACSIFFFRFRLNCVHWSSVSRCCWVSLSG